MSTQSTALPAGHQDRLQAQGLGWLEGKREGAYLHTQDGRRLIDGHCGAGVFNLGRRPQALAEELKRALRETDIGNFPMISQEKALLAQALAQFVPGALECSIFAVTRGEAMDAACKVARGYTGRPALITVDGEWYGQTGFALTLSQRDDHALFAPLIPETRSIPFGDVAALRAAVDGRTAALVIAPIQAENGCREASTEYLQQAQAVCRQQGALLIVDETQSGFGRAGARFAFEAHGIAPDILVIGEALGGGIFPIAATVLTQQVNRFMNAHPLIHLSTFGGADIGCRVALKALEIYTSAEPWKNAAAQGERLKQGITKLIGAGQTPIKAVMGRGLLLALDCGTPDAAAAFCRNMIDRGLFVVPGEVAKHTAVLRPSLMISDAEAAEILSALSC